MMEPWKTEAKILYNPKTRFIDYVVPGVIGLILQLITVTLMACTLAREREAGTLYQLMVTSLRRREIVLGKIIPYLVVNRALPNHFIRLHFPVHSMIPGRSLSLFLVRLCSLGMDYHLRVSRTQRRPFISCSSAPVSAFRGVRASGIAQR